MQRNVEQIQQELVDIGVNIVRQLNNINDAVKFLDRFEKAALKTFSDLSKNDVEKVCNVIWENSYPVMCENQHVQNVSLMCNFFLI